MKKAIWLLILCLLSAQLACAPSTSNVSPAANITNSTPAQNTTAHGFTIGPAPLPLPFPILPPHATPADFPLVVNTVIEKQYYLPGQPVKMTVRITNVGPDNVTFYKFPPEITITADEDGHQVILAEAGSDSFQLKPSFMMTYNLTWDQHGENGTQVPTGWYLVTVANVNFVRGNPPRGTLANWGDQRIDIQPSYPQGILVKDIHPNLSQVSLGNNVTLQRVSLSDNGSIFYFFCLPKGYGEHPSSVIAIGEYTINGNTKSAGFAGYGDDMSNGIKLVWGENNPLEIVPKDAKEITFKITSIVENMYNGPPIDLGGPWEFKIPLQ
ncbi:MAG: hypothetical protein Q7R50_05975 [Dehalococcoidales bacterium]|nr:hypothetical protein [Dehalococcoidales bacterium]